MIEPGPLQPPSRHKASRFSRKQKIAGGIAVGAAVVIGVGSASSHPHKAPSAKAHQAAARTVALSSGEQKFVADVRTALSAHGDSNPITDAQLGNLAAQICHARQVGGSQGAVIGVTAGVGVSGKLDMSARRMVLTAERDICPSEVPVRQTVTYVVTGSSADVTYGPAGSDLSGSVPMDVTATLGSPSYYAINAQLQGGGQVSCKILVDGKVISSATAEGGYNIAGCEISQNVITGQWENTNG